MRFKRHSIPMDTQRAVIKRDKKTCQYCGKVAVAWQVGGGRVYERDPLLVSLENGDDGYDYESNWKSNKIDIYVSFEIDHIIPVFFGGSNEMDNLKLACRYCNRSKGHEMVSTQNV